MIILVIKIETAFMLVLVIVEHVFFFKEIATIWLKDNLILNS